MTWDNLVTQAHEEALVIQPGETLTASLLTAGEKRLNQLISSLATEQATAFYQVMQTFALTTNITNYTLGSGGTFATSGGLRAMKVTAWRASYGTVMSRGGPVLSMPEFSAQATVEGGETASLPKFVGADTSYPLINVRVSPPPSYSPGTIELAYWTPLVQIADFTATYSLPDGWERMLVSNLAVDLYVMYTRAGGLAPELAAKAQNSKAAIVAQNTGSTPLPQAA